MNCSLCGLPQDTGAMASVLPQCICHWKHTPYNIMEVKELNAGGEPVKNATYWKRQYNLMASQNDNLKSGLYHANEQIKYLEAHPAKKLTLTDAEIEEIYKKIYEEGHQNQVVALGRAILRKAQEK